MTSAENFKHYNDIPESEKSNYKPVGDEGDFVENTAIEDPEVAHRIAVLMHEAFGVLETKVQEDNIDTTEIIERLTTTGLPYSEKSALLELLQEKADLARMKGEPIDEELKEALKKSYLSFRYSKVLSQKFIAGIEDGEAEVVGEICADDKIDVGYELMNKLKSDEQRSLAFELCKNRVTSACTIIDKVEDLNIALELYTKARLAVDPKSYSDKYAIESSGRNLAKKLYEAGEREKLVELIRVGTFELSNYKELMPGLGNKPEVVIDIVKYAKSVDDVLFSLKFIANENLLRELAQNTELFTNLTSEERNQVSLYASEIADALENDPRVISLSELQIDKVGDYGNMMMPQNKFVIGIQNGSFVIALSNISKHEYHKDIFQALGRTGVKSGGYISVTIDEDKAQVNMIRSSSDYGCYSREVIERFRSFIQESLQENLKGKPVELTVAMSE